jgi:flavin-dependent dehydrogenase
MNKQSAIRSPRSKIAIAGAGPAGSSLAIRLAQKGFETVLIERERFPRQKLCGEFISPECLVHFQELGVLDPMLSAGGDRIYETRFFETRGRSITVPTRWFGGGNFALSLSRAEMDHRLLERAREVGVEVLEGTAITGLECENGSIVKMKARSADRDELYLGADIFIDATGRARVLAKLAAKQDYGRSPMSTRPAIVGFKAHMTNAELPKRLCEIYSFAGGYAGLSNIEDGLANLCFLIKAETARTTGDADEIVQRLVFRNERARQMLRNASATESWLAVSVDGFGTKDPAPAANLFTVGDAAAFIDPFTGSGMVMALESASVLANVLATNCGTPETIAADYLLNYRKKFSKRLGICSVLRRTAFMPNFATVAVALLGVSSRARQALAQRTRK